MASTPIFIENIFLRGVSLYVEANSFYGSRGKPKKKSSIGPSISVLKFEPKNLTAYNKD